MASTIKVTVTRSNGVGRRENTHTLTETFQCADSHPSAAILVDCLKQVRRKFIEMEGPGSVSTDISVS